jgi:hypothetical protein
MRGNILSTNKMKEKKIKIPYRGRRKYLNFEVDYSFERLIFTFQYNSEKRITWSVEKDRVRSYPNFHKMSNRDLHEYYANTILPQMRDYFNFMTHWGLKQ